MSNIVKALWLSFLLQPMLVYGEDSEMAHLEASDHHDHKSVIERFDTSKDGKLSLQEIMVAAVEGVDEEAETDAKIETAKESIEKSFVRADEDGDKLISLEEIAKFIDLVNGQEAARQAEL